MQILALPALIVTLGMEDVSYRQKDMLTAGILALGLYHSYFKARRIEQDSQKLGNSTILEYSVALSLWDLFCP